MTAEEFENKLWKLCFPSIDPDFHKCITSYAQRLIAIRSYFADDGDDDVTEALIHEATRQRLDTEIKYLETEIQSAGTSKERKDLDFQLRKAYPYEQRNYAAIAILKAVREQKGLDPDSFIPCTESPSLRYGYNEGLYDTLCEAFRDQERWEIRNETGMMRKKQLHKVQGQICALASLGKGIAYQDDIDLLLRHFDNELVDLYRGRKNRRNNVPYFSCWNSAAMTLPS